MLNLRECGWRSLAGQVLLAVAGGSCGVEKSSHGWSERAAPGCCVPLMSPEISLSADLSSFTSLHTAPHPSAQADTEVFEPFKPRGAAVVQWPRVSGDRCSEIKGEPLAGRPMAEDIRGTGYPATSACAGTWRTV